MYFKSRLITTIIVGLCGLAFLMPLLWMISASLQTNAQIYAKVFKWFPEKLMWKNYYEVFTSNHVPLLRLYGNSLLIAFVSIVGILLVSSLAAYAFAKIDFPGKNAVFAIFIGVMMIPSQITIIPRFLLFKELGLYNTLWAVILPSLFSVTSIFLLRQFFMGLPMELSESAFLDGAGHFRILTQIILPLTTPALASLVIMNFVSTWNDYMSPLIFLVNKKNYTISLGIQYYNTSETPATELTMAIATCAVVPILIVFFSCQKYFIESIARAGIKG
ncbi:MAG: carbohydrate ABC transporter permease [Clostridiales bacterium]|nr:carbohydrate ABC transporter permease [Clostridiales bacterium]